MKERQFVFIVEIATYVQKNITNVSEEVAFFIGCQFALESNYGTSSLAKKHHNYCGMKFPTHRPTSASKIKGLPFAHYISMSYCLLDYFLLLSFRKLTTYDFSDVEHFSSAIAGWYCPEGDYITKITSIYQSFKSYKDEQNK